MSEWIKRALEGVIHSVKAMRGHGDGVMSAHLRLYVSIASSNAGDSKVTISSES